MNLSQNPFAVLEVTPRDDKSKIAIALEEKLSEGEIDEHQLMHAQKELMVSKPRLNSELSWFPNLPPNRSSEILNFIIKRDFKKIVEILETTEGISQANLAAFLCSSGKGNPKILNKLFEAQSAYSEHTLLDDINANRAISKFPDVPQPLIAEALVSIKSLHSEAALKVIIEGEHPGQIFTKIVESYVEQEREIRDFLEDVAERFDSWSVPILRDYEEKIDQISTEMKESSEPLESKINELTTFLKEWDDYSQPRQLIFQAKGLDEPRAKNLYPKMRDICLWLSNEKDEHELSLEFAKSLNEVFPELRSVADQIGDDIQSLENLVEQANADKDFEDLIKIMEEIFADEKSFCKSVGKGHFRAKGKGLAGRLYIEFQKAVKLSKGNSHESMPWELILKLAIHVNNNNSLPAVAMQLIEALLLAKPPEGVAESVKANYQVIKSNVLGNELETAIQDGKISKAITILDKIISLPNNPNNPNEKTEWLTLKSTLEDKRRSSRISTVVWWAIIIAVFYFISNNDKSKRSSKNNSRTSSSFKDSGKVLMPPVGQNRSFNIENLRWCLFEEERLKYIENQFTNNNSDPDTRKLANTQILTDGNINDLNAGVKDYNSRCGKFKYNKNDLEIVELEVAFTETDKLHREARERILKWNKNIRFEQATK